MNIRSPINAELDFDAGGKPEYNGALAHVEGLRKFYPVHKGQLLRKSAGFVKAVDGISITIAKGQTYSLVGESGCGKTTTARMFLMVEKPTAGEVYFRGKNIHKLSREERREYRASVQAVFQDPWSSLNPRMRVESIIAEPMVTHWRLSKAELRARVADLLEVVGLHPYHAKHYPHEFSGGQRQRIAIARALSTRPSLMVLDEPVSALDVSIRAQILNLLRELQQDYGLSYLLIAHNLATVRYMSHRVGVMYLGKIVEEGPPSSLFSDPKHPYTRALISAALPAHPRKQREEIVLRGEVPSSIDPPLGCPFHPRCPMAMVECSTEYPTERTVADRHWTSCHLYPASDNTSA